MLIKRYLETTFSKLAPSSSRQRHILATASPITLPKCLAIARDQLADKCLSQCCPCFSDCVEWRHVVKEKELCMFILPSIGNKCFLKSSLCVYLSSAIASLVSIFKEIRSNYPCTSYSARKGKLRHVIYPLCFVRYFSSDQKQKLFIFAQLNM